MPVTMRPWTEIRCATHRYGVVACNTIAEAVEAASADETLCVADRTVHRLFRPAFAALESAGRLLLVDANEDSKSYHAAGGTIEAMLALGVRKTTKVLVVGGGTVQDLGSYAASILMRGIPWSLISTTLLGQCDSCVGSKSSINVGAYKNQVGTFWAPERVYLPRDVLETLSWDDVRSGLGEAIKLHLLAGPQQWAWLRDRLASIREGSVTGLEAIVRSAIAIKQPYIEQDEFDKGVRNILNYGHTFGHAFETLTGHAVPHGIAVTLGMLAATTVSAERGWIARSAALELAEHLEPWYAPYDRHVASLSHNSIADAMKRDKKATRSSITCILTHGPGAMEMVGITDMTEITTGLARFKEQLTSAH